ncbi:MAG: nuclear transport factor 2 family protein [Acidiferrobacterales bacterium]
MKITGCLDKSRAERFASGWIAAWNSHDLERILAYYADDFEFSSPFVIELAGEPSGTLRGKQAVGAYWTQALARNPHLKFTLASILRGVRTLVIHYQRQDGRLASEWFEFGKNGEVIRSAAHYAG